MEEEKVIRKVTIVLAKKSIAWEPLSSSKKALAVKVYVAATEKLNRLAELNNEMKKYYFTKSSLADQLGINRKTLGHNNPEVSFLIDNLANEAKHFKLDKDNGQTGEVAELKHEINQFLERDSHYVEKDIECQKWKDMYLEQKKISDNRQKQIDKLKKEIDNLTANQLFKQFGSPKTSQS